MAAQNDDDDLEAEVEAFRKKLQAKKKGGGDEVWVRHESGTEVKITGERATNVLAKFGDLFDAPAAPDEGDDGGDEGDTPPKSGGVFGKRLGK